jgi:hypothetical protein
MNNHSEPIEWRVIGASVRGASHKRNDSPNQDRILFSPETVTGGRVFLAIADGHGGKSYFRSDTGARIAVETASDICRDFFSKQSDQEFLKIFNPKRLKEKLGRDIVAEWERRVTLDIQNNELPESPDKPVEIYPAKTKRPADNNEKIPYGTTLLSVIVQETYTMYLQLGDGDILTVSAEGEVQRPLPRDPRLMGNETTSLCSPHAWDDFIIGIVPTDVFIPALILVSTDGYANSFSDEKNYEKAAKDIFTMICASEGSIEDGVQYIDQNLPAWLDETSAKGSGDDISVGIICNLAQLKKIRDGLQEQKKSEKIGSSEQENATPVVGNMDNNSQNPQPADNTEKENPSEHIDEKSDVNPDRP